MYVIIPSEENVIVKLPSVSLWYNNAYKENGSYNKAETYVCTTIRLGTLQTTSKEKEATKYSCIHKLALVKCYIQD